MVWKHTRSGRSVRWRKASLSKTKGASGATNKTCTSSKYSIGSCPGRRWSPGFEADPRHQEILISELEQDVRGVSTPGVKNQQGKDGRGDGVETRLDEAEAHSFRSTVARVNYLALDGPDLAFATKGFVPKDVGANESRHKRTSHGCPGICCQRPASVYEFPWRSANLDVFVDNGCPPGVCPLGGARRGGAAVRGLPRHQALEHRRKKAVMLSSAEAELCGIVKGTTEALGIQSVVRDPGLSMTLSVHADSAAVVGIWKRAGIGRVRYLALGWTSQMFTLAR